MNTFASEKLYTAGEKDGKKKMEGKKQTRKKTTAGNGTLIPLV